jgi:hypothetical protein
MVNSGATGLAWQTINDLAADASPKDADYVLTYDASVGTHKKVLLENLPGDKSFVFKFSTTTTDADPGNGYFRFNSATPASISQIYIDLLNNAGRSLATLWAMLDLTHRIFIQQLDDPSRSLFFTLGGGAVVDATTYYKIPCTVESVGTLPENNALCSVMVLSYSTDTLQTDPIIEGMPVHEDASGDAEWVFTPKVLGWRKHFLFPASVQECGANGIRRQYVGAVGTYALSTYTTNDGVHEVVTGNSVADGAGYTFADEGGGNIHDGTVKFAYEGWFYHDSDGSFTSNGYAYEIWFGITDSLFGAGAEQALFYGSNVSTAANQWDCITTGGGTSTTTGSGVGCRNAWQRLKCTYDGSSARFYINGTLVATHTTNLPLGTQMYFFWGAVTGDPAPFTMEVDHAGYIHEPDNV